jgi:hypothetical protein
VRQKRLEGGGKEEGVKQERGRGSYLREEEEDQVLLREGGLALQSFVDVQSLQFLEHFLTPHLRVSKKNHI